MSRNRFVDPGVTKIDLSDGDWIEVRDDLTWGAKQKLASAGLGGMQGFDSGDLATVKMDIDFAAFEIERVVAWVVDWSFRDANDKPVQVSRAAVERLDEETANEIRAALDVHVKAIEEKKGSPRTTTAANGRSP